MSDLGLMDTKREEIMIGNKGDGNPSYIIEEHLVEISPRTSWQSFHRANKHVSLEKIRMQNVNSLCCLFSNGLGKK